MKASVFSRPTLLLGIALQLTLIPLMPTTVRAANIPVCDIVQPFIDRGEVAGVVFLVSTKDGPVTCQALGYADRAADRAMMPDSLFWIASQSKPITATAVMMLVDEGKIDLDAPVEKYLPEFKGQKMEAGKDASGAVILKSPSHPITVREVLSHTSGLPFKSKVEEPTMDASPLKAAVASYAATPLLWEPGGKYLYSNAGINTAARIIEVVTGKKYESFMDTRLFKPLGMKDTTFWPSKKQLKRLATPYKPNAAKTALEPTTIGQLQYPLDDRKKRFPMPAGGLFSTASDVSVFCQMILNGGEWKGRRYLSEKAVKEMTRRQTPSEMKESYGLGWTAGPVFGHGGALATGMSIDPQSGLINVWLVQHAGFIGDGAKAQGVFRKAATEMFGSGKSL
ncbi:MAG TPA: serine hydrolase domain-containing protein [Roseimicrobium sp.]|nr:serine hydrolase domain-containing protein [Roseimicrobium sp.]